MQATKTPPTSTKRTKTNHLKKTPRVGTGRYVTIYLSTSLASHYEEKARELQTTVGKLIKERLETKPVTVFDKLKDLIEDTGSGPVDLSTNPIYFKGFGEDIQPAKFKK